MTNRVDTVAALERPLRIVHVLRAPVGGLFRHVLDLSNEQIARGHSVGLIANSLTGGARGDALLAELEPKLALGLMRLPMRRLPHHSDLKALTKVIGRLRDLSPDVVHGHGSKGGLYARLSRVWPVGGATRAYTPHGGSLNYNPGSFSHRLFMTVEGSLSYLTDALLFESAYIDQRYRLHVGPPRKMSSVVRNGVAPKEFEPVAPNPDAADFLYVGEFRSVKGLDTLIDALALLAATTNRRPRVALVGDGPDRSLLLQIAERRGVAAQLRIEKPMPAREAFALGRIMIVPSRAESLPYIVLEAAAAQLPLIATRVGGVPEIFGPHSKRLIESDNPRALCAAMSRTLDEDPRDQAMKARALAEYVAGQFSLGKMVDDVLSTYRTAIAARI